MLKLIKMLVRFLCSICKLLISNFFFVHGVIGSRNCVIIYILLFLVHRAENVDFSITFTSLLFQTSMLVPPLVELLTMVSLSHSSRD